MRKTERHVRGWEGTAKNPPPHGKHKGSALPSENPHHPGKTKVFRATVGKPRPPWKSQVLGYRRKTPTSLENTGVGLPSENPDIPGKQVLGATVGKPRPTWKTQV